MTTRSLTARNDARIGRTVAEAFGLHVSRNEMRTMEPKGLLYDDTCPCQPEVSPYPAPTNH